MSFTIWGENMDIDITKMSSRGQVVLPQEIRDHKGLKEGEKFLVYTLDDSIVLKRIQGLETKNRDDFDKVFAELRKAAKQNGITREDVTQEIKAHREKNA
jgi:AbrB family looped-hinge helix DNA binding protein